MTIVPDHLAALNSLRHSQWAVRWAVQGGSRFWHARPLEDLRSPTDHWLYHKIERKRRQTGLGRRARIVNLSHERMERVRKKARSGT